MRRFMGIGTLVLLGVSLAGFCTTQAFNSQVFNGYLPRVFAGAFGLGVLMLIALIVLGRRRPSAEVIAKAYAKRPAAVQSGKAVDLLASGQRVRGVLKAFADTGTTARSKGTTPSRPQFLDDPIYVLDVDLYLSGGAPVDGRTIGRVPRARVHSLVVGMELPCAVNPLNAAHYFVVDWGDWGEVADGSSEAQPGPAAGARLMTLSPADLATELMPAFGSLGGTGEGQLVEWLARAHEISSSVRWKNRSQLRARVLEAVQLLEHAGLVYVDRISEDGNRYWNATRAGLAAVAEGSCKERIQTRAGQSAAQRLRDLETLRATGAISEDEYSAKRQQVIADI